jgi:spermidine synthase
MATLLCVVFCLSGAASLLFENLWFQRAGLALGNSVWASSLVLAAFMGGLAIGNGIASRFGHRVARPAGLYAALELVIGAAGVAIVLGFPALIPALAAVLGPFADQPAIANAVRLGVAFVLFLVPATAMGATLPLLVRELHRADPIFGHALGRLYGWNTLGALCGALAGELALYAWIGLRGTALLAGSLNVLAGVGAWYFSRRVEGAAAREVAPGMPWALPRAAFVLLGGAFASGAVLLALEVVWFRFLVLFTLPGSVAFALMLTVVLLGIGAGGLLGARVLRQSLEAVRLAPILLALSAALCVATYAGFGGVVSRVSSDARTEWWGIAVLGIALMLPVSLVSGMLFTLLGEALYPIVGSATRSAGLLAFANTTGAMLGALAGGFVLLPVLGIERSIRLLAGVYAATAVLLAAAALRPSTRREFAVLAIAVGAALLAVLPLFPSGVLRSRYLAYPLEPFTAGGRASIAALRETLTETLIYLRSELLGEPRHFRLVTNSHSMSGTMFVSQRYMRLFVWLPVALHPEPRKALLISYGVGTTAKALVDTRELTSIDVVDVSRDVLELNRVVWDDPNDYPLADPRIRIHIEDGRQFLQTTAQRFDLITGEPPPPKNAGIVSLYTREFFALVRDRLEEGGLASYWLPVHTFEAEEAKSIVRAFCDVFPDCSLWSGSLLDWVLLGSRDAKGPVTRERFEAQWHDPVVAPVLRDLGIERPELLGTLFLAGPEDLRELTAATPPLVDDWPKRLGDRVVSIARAQEIWNSWFDAAAQRDRFARSAVVARLFPADVRAASLRWFERGHALEVALETAFRSRANPAAALPEAHRALTETDLRTLPLWRLGSNVDVQRPVRRAIAKGKNGALAQFELGVAGLADRDWTAAERGFRASYTLNPKRPALHYWLYALCMDGRFEEAARLAERNGVRAGKGKGDAEVWSFLSGTFPEVAAGTRERVRPLL